MSMSNSETTLFDDLGREYREISREAAVQLVGRLGHNVRPQYCEETNEIELPGVFATIFIGFDYGGALEPDRSVTLSVEGRVVCDADTGLLHQYRLSEPVDARTIRRDYENGIAAFIEQNQHYLRDDSSLVIEEEITI